MIDIIAVASIILNFFNLFYDIPFEEIASIQLSAEDLGLVWQDTEHNGRTRKWLQYVPESVETNPALMIVLHGLNGNAGTLFTAGVPQYAPLLKSADEKGFVIVAPEAEPIHVLGISLPMRSWNDYGKWWLQPAVDDVGFIETLIDWAVQEHNVDRSRVFLSGVSGGGSLAYRLLNERSALFAAVAPLISLLTHKGAVPAPDPYVATPMITIIGNLDPYFLYLGGNAVFYNSQSFDDSLSYFANLNGASPTKITYSEVRTPSCVVDHMIHVSEAAPVEAYVAYGHGHLVTGTNLHFVYEPFHPFIFSTALCEQEFRFIPVMVAFFERFGL